MSLYEILSLPLSEGSPDATETYPGHLYYHAEKHIYFTVFESIYGDFEVNNWLPRKINAGTYKLVKKDEERFYGLNQTNSSDRIPLKFMGEVPILCDDWVLVSADKVILEEALEEPEPEVEVDLTIPIATAQTSVLESALEDGELLYSTLTSMLLAPMTPPHIAAALDAAAAAMPPPMTLPPPSSTGALEAIQALLNWQPNQSSRLDWNPSCYTPPYAKQIAPPQKRIADIMIADAVSKEIQCPISLNPLTLASAACVAPCYHIFEKEAIQTWLQEKKTCPECREPCSL